MAAIVKRSDEVRAQIEAIRGHLVENLLLLGELLSETKQEDYHLQWGFGDFWEWLDQSGLDIKKRMAYYLIKVVENSRELGIPREQLAASKISKLNEIFSLDPSKHGDTIKKLVADSSNLSLKAIHKEVRALRGADSEELVWCNFLVTESQAEIVGRAIEKVRMEYGNTIDSETHELIDISRSRALELLCADYLSGK